MKKEERMNLLFICKYNRFRSKTAEAYFKKTNKNKNIKVKSAGLIKGSPLNPKTIKIIKDLGISIKGPTRGISSKLLVWQNMIVIVADNVSPKIFNNKRFGKPIIQWKIKDATNKGRKDILAISRNIMNHVDKLIKSLKNTR